MTYTHFPNEIHGEPQEPTFGIVVGYFLGFLIVSYFLAHIVVYLLK